jgi:hypothetical protein
MFILGLIYGSFLEWGVHKYLFHELGKNKNSIFAFHLREHHINCINNQNEDNRFTLRENLGIAVLTLLHLPIFFLSSSLYYGLAAYGLAFIICHKLIHKNAEWGKKWFPWHWDHHMAHQNHNMNVVIPIADHILGTRKKDI